MKLNKYWLVIVLVFSNTVFFAQNTKVIGVVKDSIGNPLEMANVVAVNANTGIMQEYAITNTKGVFTLSLLPQESYNIMVSYLGFDTKTIKTNTDKNTAKLNLEIVLSESKNVLDEVEITYEMPITIKGDTIVYNSDSFRNGTEKKLEDVLEKLPGVEVNEDGEVEIEGKRVAKVMVEGKDFFDGDSKVAVQNIPANALSKIEVLRNYNEVNQMKGVTNNEDSIAINIKLKKGKDKFWFGEAAAGAGPDGRYLVHPKIFYYSPKTSVSVLTDFNNIGKTPFTTRDYYRFTGGLRSVAAKGGTSLNLENNSVGLSNMQNNRALDISSEFGATNFNHNFSDKLSFSGFGIYSGTSTEMAENSSKNYQDSGDIENTKTITKQRSDLGLFKFSTKYLPSVDLQVDYDLFLKQSKQTEEKLRSSFLNDVDNGYINSNLNDQPFSLVNNLNIYKTLNEKNIFAFEGQYLYQKELPYFNSLSDVLNVKESLTPPLVETAEGYDMTQNKTIDTYRFDAKLDYYYVINDQSHLNITLGTLQSTQDFHSSMFQQLEDGTKNDFTADRYNNDVRFYFSDVYTGAHYKVVKNNLTLEPGVKLHLYQTKDSQLATDNSNTMVRLLPDFYAKYQFKKTESLRFNYELSNQFTDVKKLAEGLVFNNYNAVYAGNRNLENAIFQKYSLNYFNFIMYNYTNVNASISYTKKEQTIKSDTEFSGIGQDITSINSIFPDESFTGRFRYGRTFKKIKVNVRTNGDYSKNNNIRNGDWFVNNVWSYSYGGDVGTNFNKAPNIKIGYTRSTNDYGTQSFHTDKPYARFDANFLKSFILSIDYDYYNYYDSAKTISNNFTFLEAELSFRKPDTKWEYILSGTNLLNTRSLNRDQINIPANTVTTSTYFVQPRYVLLTVKYNLK